jgi:hypothetical protein
MPGPAPSPNPRRSNPRPELVLLPAGGYAGEVPPWPLGRQSKAEAEAWPVLWRTPQATAWARMQLARTVARYVRALVKAERPSAAAFLLSEVRQLEDRLGLTPMAMLRLRWEIAPDQLAEQREPAPEGAEDRRRRLSSAG